MVGKPFLTGLLKVSPSSGKQSILGEVRVPHVPELELYCSRESSKRVSGQVPKELGLTLCRVVSVLFIQALLAQQALAAIP